jgi:uncharacterized membrane protein
MAALFTPSFTVLLILIEVACLAGIVYMFRLIAGNMATLPARVPMHFGLNGVPDAWHGKAMLWLLPGLVLFLYLLLTGSAVTIPLNPQGYHGLARPLTPELLGPLNRASVLMVELLKAEIIGMFLFLTGKIMTIARGDAKQLSPWFGLIMIVGMLATVGLFMLYLKYVLHV